MTQDEHEARLRERALHRHAGWCGGSVDGCTYWQEEEAALDAYADWLRLRERAENGCGRIIPNGTCSQMKLCENTWCPSCAAEQQIAAILAAAGGAE